EVGDVGLVVLGDVGDEAPGEAHLPGGQLADPGERLALHGAEVLEARQRWRDHRRAGDAGPRSRGPGGELLDVVLDVVLGGPAAPPTAGDLMQIDAQLPRQPPGGRAGDDNSCLRAGSRGGWRFRTRY